MKTTHTLILASLIAFVGCGEKVSELDQKKASLKTLKEQLGEIKTQILTLEKEIDLADTLAEDGIAVNVQEVAERSFAHYINQPGIVTSRANVVVSSEVGATVVRRLVEEGSWVSKDQAIVQLDANVMVNQVEDLRQSVELAKTTFERQDNLWKQGIGSEIQFLQAKNQYQSLSKKLAASEAQLDKYEIVSPVSGRLDEIFINEGEFTSPGKPAFRVVNSKRLQIEVDVAERYSSILKKRRFGKNLL
ncbi:efflux RND transporter periplasmic adaptor subunit [Flavobacteriales bacterium]|nr:efflux RND transporter periplasmic adaptor subunit [Flavobacteriales bacterium]